MSAVVIAAEEVAEESAQAVAAAKHPAEPAGECYPAKQLAELAEALVDLGWPAVEKEDYPAVDSES